MKKLSISENYTINLCKYLLVTIFLSKLSFKWTKVFPKSISPIIFQHGLHPYVNFGIQFIIFIIISHLVIQIRKKKNSQFKITSLCMSTLTFILFVQTIFQIFLININQSTIIQIAGFAMAALLIIFYGIIIPSVLSIEMFLRSLKKYSLYFVGISLFVFPFAYTDMFKGGRFIGVFKHIPHMVTASTCAYILHIPELFSIKRPSLKDNIFIKVIIQIFLGVAVILTFTKAAIFTISTATIIGFIIFGSKKKQIRLFKFCFLSSIVISILLVGYPASHFIIEIATGKTSFGSRRAQNGIESRLDEIRRGEKMFEKSPFFGQGLLYKFFNNSKEGIEVESYNSFKDPHNLFVSSAVIGGYPLLIFSLLAFLILLIGSLRSLQSSMVEKQLIGLFLISHLPVFLIYHAHFSLGGMADRIYWLFFGYLGKNIKLNEQGEL